MKSLFICDPLGQTSIYGQCCFSGLGAVNGPSGDSAQTLRLSVRVCLRFGSKICKEFMQSTFTLLRGVRFGNKTGAMWGRCEGTKKGFRLGGVKRGPTKKGFIFGRDPCGAKKGIHLGGITRDPFLEQKGFRLGGGVYEGSVAETKRGIHLGALQGICFEIYSKKASIVSWA